MEPVQPPPILTGPRPRRRAFLAANEVGTLIGAQVVTLLFFPFLGLTGIFYTIEASKAAWNMAVFVLPVPAVTALVYAYKYARRSVHRRGAGAPSPNALIISVAAVLFWIGALGWQSHEDAVFQRNLEVRIQPWAESTLARPRADVVDKGSCRLRDALVPTFLGHTSDLLIQNPAESAFTVNERCIVVFYGSHATPNHGYIVGGNTLAVAQGGRRGVRKVKAGLYRFQEEN